MKNLSESLDNVLLEYSRYIAHLCLHLKLSENEFVQITIAQLQ